MLTRYGVCRYVKPVTVFSFMACASLGLFWGSPTSAAFLGSTFKPGAALNINADNTVYDQDKGTTQFLGHVKVKYDDVEIIANRADVSLNAAGSAKLATFPGRPLVRRKHPTKGLDELIANTLEIDIEQNNFKAIGNVQSDMRTIAAAPIRVLSDVQQFNNNTQLLTASGAVRVFHKDITVTSNQAVMRLGANNQAERVVFVGNAVLQQGKSVIKANQITIVVGSENLLAEGNVRSNVHVPGKEGKAASTVVMNSDYQQFDKAANSILSSGHVLMLYEDYRVTGPKAVIRLKPGGGMEVDNMLLTSRPTIVDKERRVTADTILVTTTPKRFDARGNVKTFFQSAPKKAGSSASTQEGKSSKNGKPVKGGTKGSKATGSTKPVAPTVLTEEQELGL